MAEAARRVRKDILVLCHGGPIAEPDDVEFILRNGQGIDSFLGGSSMDRLPTERAIKEQVSRFKNLDRRL
jgi:predicted TIM-barrel enzyme